MPTLCSSIIEGGIEAGSVVTKDAKLGLIVGLAIVVAVGMVFARPPATPARPVSVSAKTAPAITSRAEHPADSPPVPTSSDPLSGLPPIPHRP